MSVIVTQINIDDSSDKTITGVITFDRANGGTLIVPAGSAFPGSPTAGELFWRTDLVALYRRNSANTTWETQATTPSNNPTIQFGVGSLATSTTTRFLVPGFLDGNAPTTRVSVPMTRPGTVRNLYVRHNTPGTGSQTITYSVRKNNAATTVTCSMASTGTQASDTTNSFSVSSGDVLDIQVTRSATLTSSPVNVIATLEID
jgi:hypothetical protein